MDSGRSDPPSIAAPAVPAPVPRSPGRPSEIALDRRDGLRLTMGYHGMVWGSMGFHSKSLEIPGFLLSVALGSPMDQNKTRSKSRLGTMLATHCGEMMFFFCSSFDWSTGEKRQTACKPGSVPAPHGAMDDHSSGTSVAGRLARPTRAATRKRARPRRFPCGIRPACRPYAVLLPVGFTVPLPLPAARCALTAPFHPCRRTILADGRRRFAFCGTFPGVAPAGCYPAPCFRGARTFLPPTVTGRGAAIQPSGEG
jgi:hypothetical protein